MKELLAAIWKHQFTHGHATLSKIKDEINCSVAGNVEEALERLKLDGLITITTQGYKLSKIGRNKIIVVACGGVFDILHPGHAFILKEAKALGDVLAVIVARDSTVEKRKRIPIVPESQRVAMVSELKPVDVAVLGYKGDPLEIIEDIRPDVIALGPDQHHDEENIKNGLNKRGLSLEVKRLREYKECELNSTKVILQRIMERGYPNERMGV